MSNIDNDADPQDRAEVLDETNLTADGRNIANFDDVSDVYDATAAADDAELEDDADLDEDDMIERDDTGLRAGSEDRSFASDEDRIGSDQERTRNYEASGGTGDKDDATQVDPAEDADDEKDPHVDRQLDKGLKETFPASDPVSINPGAD
jgi:hypothetical protein